MKINTDDLIKIYRSYIQEQIPQSRNKCPSLETIMNFFMTSGSNRKKGRIVDHLTSCGYCAHEFGLFLEIYREEGILLEEIDRLLLPKEQLEIAEKKKAVSNLFRWSDSLHLRPYWKYALSFLLASTAVAVTILITNQVIITQKNIERGRIPGQIQLMAPAHGKPIQAPFIFKWKLVEKFDYCILEIFDEALSPVWKSPRIHKDFYQLPPDIGAKIEKNKIYYWMITIFFVDGKVIESAFENFTLIN
jgi:hypothetical protein